MTQLPPALDAVSYIDRVLDDRTLERLSDCVSCMSKLFTPAMDASSTLVFVAKYASSYLLSRFPFESMRRLPFGPGTWALRCLVWRGGEGDRARLCRYSRASSCAGVRLCVWRGLLSASTFDARPGAPITDVEDPLGKRACRDVPLGERILVGVGYTGDGSCAVPRDDPLMSESSSATVSSVPYIPCLRTLSVLGRIESLRWRVPTTGRALSEAVAEEFIVCDSR